MKDGLKLLGFALFILFALLLGRAYSGYCKRRISSLESLSRMLGELEERVTLFLSTPTSFFADYEDKLLEDCGFLPMVRSGESMADAFAHSSGKLSLDEETRKRLDRFFKDFGKSYRDGEVKRIGIFRAELEEVLRREREEEPKRVKLAYTLLFASALGAVILLI